MYKGLSVNTAKCDADFVLENLSFECAKSKFYENDIEKLKNICYSFINKNY